MSDVRKRVCMVVQNYYDIDPRVRREAEGLIEEDFAVDVLCLRMKGRQRRTYDLNGVHVISAPIEKRRTGRGRYVAEYLFFFVWAAIELLVRMLRHRYQVIQVHTLPDFLVFAATIPKLMGAKVILDMHEVMPEFYASKFDIPGEHWIVRLIRFLERLSFSFADHVIVINEPIRQLLQSRGLPESKTTVIMNSVHEKLFTEYRPSGNSQSDKPFVFMYHGTLTFMYGLDISLRAFVEASRRMERAEFWIVGDGPESASLRLLAHQLGAADRVRFIGMVPQDEIPQWLAQSDVGVLATRQDSFLNLSFSNKLPEYIVMGKPVIVSRLNAIRHYFSDDALAYFQPLNEKELAEQMVELYQNRDRRRRLSERAVEEYSAIDWQTMKQRFLSLYESS